MLAEYVEVPGMAGVYVNQDGAVIGRRGHPLLVRNGAVQVWVDGRNHGVLVGRLVLLAFCGPGEPDDYPLHRGGDKNDSRLENLRWRSSVAHPEDLLQWGFMASVGEEVWLRHPHYRGTWVSSKEGRVLSDRMTLLSHVLPPSGKYSVVSFKDRGLHVVRGVHRMVAEAHCLQGWRDGLIVRHLDGNPRNNDSSNLTWGTHVENQQDSVRHGTKAVGSRSNQSNLTDSSVREMRDLYAKGGVSLQELARRYRVSKKAVLQIIHRRHWRHVA